MPEAGSVPKSEHMTPIELTNGGLITELLIISIVLVRKLMLHVARDWGSGPDDASPETEENTQSSQERVEIEIDGGEISILQNGRRITFQPETNDLTELSITISTGDDIMEFNWLP